MPGPIPKRSTERRRVNATPGLQTARVSGPQVKPLPLRRGLHPVARQWYKALAESGQSRFYEPSDWAMAVVLAEAINDYMDDPKANTLAAIMQGSSLLLATEGDRRRMRLELTREVADVDDDAAAAAVDHWLRAVPE